MTGQAGKTDSEIATMAGALWDLGDVDDVADVYASEYINRMENASAETALWMASHYDDHEGTGEFESDIDEVRYGWAPTYIDALPDDARDELQRDVAAFVREAWPYLSADAISPEQAGHDFMLSRNGAGAGFWDRNYRHGRALHALAEVYGAYGLEIDGHGDDAHVASHHNLGEVTPWSRGNTTVTAVVGSSGYQTGGYASSAMTHGERNDRRIHRTQRPRDSGHAPRTTGILIR
jgi:hypothetical protein